MSSTLAMVFPGQGSQKVGMLAEYYEAYQSFSGTFDRASEVLGFDLWAMIQEGPQESLNLTENTQPVLLTCSVALWNVWRELGGASPSYMAGHSLGEWSALVCSEVISLEDAVRLVRLRGRYLQEAVPVGEGAMAAIIGLDDDVIIDLCDKQQNLGAVSAVNFNAPGQVVIAGKKEAVEAAGEACKEAGAKRAMPLPVSAPFHSILMKPAAERLALDLESVNFNDPVIPIVHNVNAQTETSGAAVKSLMIEQVDSPVRWVECVKALSSFGVDKSFECGPGKVLAGMIKRIDRSMSCTALESLESLRTEAASSN
jgi:[acyl-carrier-protein] S-malonyltransferase